MNPRVLPQPLSPTPAKGSAPRRLRTLGLAFLLALFGLVLWGGTAHAEEAVGVDPVEVVVLSVVPVATPDAAVPALAASRRRVGNDASREASRTEVAAATAPRATAAPFQRSFVNMSRARLTIQAHVAPAVHQCNADTYPTGAGWEASCVVTVENTLGSDGSTGSRVTTTWCLAEAGVLPPEGCTTDVSTSDNLVTTVAQCNGILAGGSNVTCSVEVVNNVPFGTTTSDVTVNQCVGSGQGGVSPGGPPTDCDPVDSSTSGATVTQCNGSANGGGAPERVQCAVTGNATALPVTVNQCNGSTAAGSTVTCDVTYTNNFAAAATEPGGTPTAMPAPTATPVAPVSSTPGVADLAETARFTPAASTTSSPHSIADGPPGTATSLALTGPGTSTSRLLSAALMLLVLGGLLLAGSTRRS